MNRFEQHKRKRLLNLEIAEGYRETTAELRFLQATKNKGKAEQESK